MNDPLYQKLLEASWQRPLTPEEEAELQPYLAAHPEAQAEWDEDILLTQQLRQLPAAPLSSNFTALVLQAVKAEAGRPRRDATSFGWLAWVRQYLPRAASVGAPISAPGCKRRNRARSGHHRRLPVPGLQARATCQKRGRLVAGHAAQSGNLAGLRRHCPIESGANGCG